MKYAPLTSGYNGLVGGSSPLGPTTQSCATGRIIAEMESGGERWHIVSLPAEAEAGDLLGREPGQWLWDDVNRKRQSIDQFLVSHSRGNKRDRGCRVDPTTT
jgi:hypothetical protein